MILYRQTQDINLSQMCVYLSVYPSSGVISRHFISQLYRFNKTDIPGLVYVALCSSQEKMQLDSKYVSVILFFILKLQVFQIFHQDYLGKQALEKKQSFLFVCFLLFCFLHDICSHVCEGLLQTVFISWQVQDVFIRGIQNPQLSDRIENNASQLKTVFLGFLLLEIRTIMWQRPQREIYC